MRTWQQAITAFTQYVAGVIGNIGSLTTTDKSSLVAAINEVAAGGGGGGLPVVNPSARGTLTVEPVVGSDNDGHVRVRVIDGDVWTDSATDGGAVASAVTGTHAQGTLDAPTAVVLGDILRYLWWWDAHDGTDYSSASVAYLQVDDDVSAGVVPTALVIEQTDEAGVLQETFRIASDGTVTAAGLPAGGVVIDDGTPAADKVWSSEKTEAEIASAGGLVKIASGAFSGASNVPLTDYFTSTYDDYRLILTVTASSATGRIGLRLRDSGGTDATTGYVSVVQPQGSSGVSYTDNLAAGYRHNTSGKSTSAVDLSGVALAEHTHGNGLYSSTPASGNAGTVQGWHAAATAYPSVDIVPVSGTIDGRWALYGYAK